MLRKDLSLVTGLVVGLAVMGCPDKPSTDVGDPQDGTQQTCASNQDCPAGQTCRGGACQAPCLVDLDCPAGHLCMDGTCVGNAEGCTTSSDCPAGHSCRDGLCEPGCVGHADCLATQHCQSGSCVDGAPCTDDQQCTLPEVCGEDGVCRDGCTQDASCPTGQVCVNGRCHPCTADSECGTGRICKEGVCATGCRTTADCQGGLVCRGTECVACAEDGECAAGHRCTTGVCEPRPTCTVDGDCIPAQHCQDGACVDNPGCSTASPCPSSETCVNGTCVRNPACDDTHPCSQTQVCQNGTCVNNPACTTNQDCLATQTCVSGTCTNNSGCTDNTDCPTSHTCVNGTCTRNPGCSGDGDCLATQQCTNGICSYLPGCTTDEQCSATQHCQGGTCVRNQGCVTTADCPAWEHCVDGTCTRNPGCTSSAQCLATQTCINGTCHNNGDCLRDPDCPSTQNCVAGVCTNNPACTGDGNCAADQSCVAGVCTQNPACTVHTDCLITQTCVDGVCTDNPPCTMHGECSATQYCDGQFCARGPQCTTDVECPAAEHCLMGRCVSNFSCTNGVDCPLDQQCLNGVCNRNPACENNTCPTGLTCVEGACLQERECSKDDQCQDGSLCNGVERCDYESGGKCKPGTPIAVDDGIECTQDTCDPQTGTVSHQGRDDQCQDNNPCTVGHCNVSAGCVQEADPTAVPPQQANGDCHRELCQEDQVVSLVDNSDLPAGDGIACTVEVCVEGVATHRPDHDPCVDTNPCTVDVCQPARGGCTHDPDFTASLPQTSGDCQRAVCQNGQPVSLMDNTDVPAPDGVACTVESCAAGVPQSRPDSSLCNDTNPCTVDLCQPARGGCTYDPDSSAVLPQNSGDCHKDVCLEGLPQQVVDVTDVPAPDSFTCTREECVGGTPRVRTDASLCQDGNLCNGEERCLVGQGCQPATSPLTCGNPDSCHVGFCNAATGCDSRLVDADGDGHVPVACGGDDCDDTHADTYPGHAEIPGDGRDNDCDGLVDEGTGTLSCPPAPVGRRILEEISLTATVRNTVGPWTIRWTVQDDPSVNNDSTALMDATTLTVRLIPVLRGNYVIRARLIQQGASDQTCDVAFSVVGPDEQLAAELRMFNSVDVDLHLMHPVGKAADTNYYFWDINWGPTNDYTCRSGTSGSFTTCDANEDTRVLPDCHYSNCPDCTVDIPDQPACVAKTLHWDENTTRFNFAGSAARTVDVIPHLQIDNQRGCYTDSLGNRVCTPERISIKRPRAVAGDRYTVVVHYWGEPIVKTASGFTGNQRGVAPPGLSTVDVELELFCSGVGYKRFRCDDIPVNGYCFVADMVWNGNGGCSAIESGVTGITRRLSKVLQTDATNGPYWTNTSNVLATPIQ